MSEKRRPASPIRLATAIVAALLLALAATSSAEARSRTPVSAMSSNIWWGTELSHSRAAHSVAELTQAVAADWNSVKASNIPARAAVLANEIKARRPDLVGLQEAALWRTQFPAGSSPKVTHVAYDFVQLLVRALAAHGEHYRAVAITNNFDIQGTGSFAGGSMDVRLTDRVAILARSGAGITKVQTKNYVSHDTLPVAGVPFPVLDGFASVDVKVGGTRVRFVTTHLAGTLSPTVREGEAAELVAGPLKTKLPLLLSCDCNSEPTTHAYHGLTASGLKDAWKQAHPRAAGFTCCHLRNQSDLEPDLHLSNPRHGVIRRIDFVFARGPFAVLGADLVGLDPKRDRTPSGSWPTDHLAVIARFSLP